MQQNCVTHLTFNKNTSYFVSQWRSWGQKFASFLLLLSKPQKLRWKHDKLVCNFCTVSLSIFIFSVLYFFVIELVGLCCKPQPLVIIIIINVGDENEGKNLTHTHGDTTFNSWKITEKTLRDFHIPLLSPLVLSCRSACTFYIPVFSGQCVIHKDISLQLQL